MKGKRWVAVRKNEEMKQIRLSKGSFYNRFRPKTLSFDSFSWCASHESQGTKWYAVRFEKSKKVRMHRLIAERAFGEIPRKVTLWTN